MWLDVPYADKDEAKALGARWDARERRWYAGPRAHPDLHTRWGARPELPITLPGEDRSFGTGLFVDLIPSTVWFSNVRSAVDGADWERLRRMLSRRAEQRCELCGRGPNRQLGRYLEAHERFAYDEATGTQQLKRLVLVCSGCHEVTHFGLAELRGRGPEAFAHLRAVTRMTEDAALAHVQDAFARWRARSTREWSLDLSPLTKAGITVSPPPQPAARARGAEQELRRHHTPTTATGATTAATTRATTRAGTAGGTAWAVVPGGRTDAPATRRRTNPEPGGAVRALPPPGSCDCPDPGPHPSPVPPDDPADEHGPDLRAAPAESPRWWRWWPRR